MPELGFSQHRRSRSSEGTSPAHLNITFCVAEDRQSGTYFRIHGLARGLVTRGHAVTVLSQAVGRTLRRRRENRDGVEYRLAPSLAAPSRVPNTVNLPHLLFRAIQGNPRTDVLHLSQPFLPAALPWLRARRSFRPPLCAYDWDDLWWNYWEKQLNARARKNSNAGKRASVWLRNLLEQNLPRQAHLVTTCSTALADMARRRGARDSVVIANGSDPIVRADREKSRAQLNLQPDAFYLAFAGWTLMHVDWCFELLRRVRIWAPEARLAFCGSDPRSLPQLGSFWDDACDYVGVLSGPDCSRYCQAVDVLLLPLLNDEINQCRFPMKFAEYVGSGTPVLCSAVGECALRGETIDTVHLVDPTPEGWLEDGEARIREIYQKHRRQPDTATNSPLPSNLYWSRIAEDLENAYLAAMNRITSDSGRY